MISHARDERKFLDLFLVYGAHVKMLKFPLGLGVGYRKKKSWKECVYVFPFYIWLV